MEDYEVSGDQSYATLAHYDLLSYCDPTIFQEAVKDSNSQKDMWEFDPYHMMRARKHIYMV